MIISAIIELPRIIHVLDPAKAVEQLPVEADPLGILINSQGHNLQHPVHRHQGALPPDQAIQINHLRPITRQASDPIGPAHPNRHDNPHKRLRGQCQGILDLPVMVPPCEHRIHRPVQVVGVTGPASNPILQGPVGRDDNGEELDGVPEGDRVPVV